MFAKKKFLFCSTDEKSLHTDGEKIPFKQSFSKVVPCVFRLFTELQSR